jgi:hypothetical protein
VVESCGYPEHFAQEALGHNSIAVHRAYAKRARVKIPSLDEYERKAQVGKIPRFPEPRDLERQRADIAPLRLEEVRRNCFPA